MSLETATLISDLSPSNPTAGDPKSQGDDHLRMIKTVLQNQFPDASAGAIYGLRSASSQASTSGTSIDFTGIPAWVKRITVCLAGVSTNGNSNLQVQIGDSGGIESTGYTGSVSQILSGSTTAANLNSGFPVTASIAATSVVNGSVVLNLLDASANTWVSSSAVGFSDTAQSHVGGGAKSLSATLDRVRITTTGGTNAFDAGTINILCE